jgi:Cu-Zn family superoxide dismutase
MAVAVLRTKQIEGDILVESFKKGVKLVAHFTKLPKGKHGFHIHRAGDLRGEVCQGLCEHYDRGKNQHGDGPFSKRERHTGDLGNIEIKEGETECHQTYYLPGVSVQDLWGRSIIVHEGEDDLGLGEFEDSKVTGHSGKRIGCAIFGRLSCSSVRKTRKKSR